MTISVEIIKVQGDGVMLSRIVARKFRKYLPHFVERIYDINPGLAALGPIIPVGTEIKFPTPTADETRAAVKIVKLWE